jgi:putative aminopeptidase FrvX
MNNVFFSALNKRVTEAFSIIEKEITTEAASLYVRRISNISAPSTAASRLRFPVIKELLNERNNMKKDSIHLYSDFDKTGNMVVITGKVSYKKPVWILAHSDTISYLIQPGTKEGYPLVANCHHMIKDGFCNGKVYRYNLMDNLYEVISRGKITTKNSAPFYTPENEIVLVPGDRVVLDIKYNEIDQYGLINAHVDNAGGIAAALLAVPILAEMGIEALIAFPDEEEGPHGSGNQMIGRGGTRLLNLLEQPDLVLVGDVQQAGGYEAADTRGGVENKSRMGNGAVLSEFSSLGRGAVTPPHLYVLAREYAQFLSSFNVKIQESNNAYSSRSDDISMMLKTPNILLLGFPGINRHGDSGLPAANINDIVNLAKSFVYYALLQELYSTLNLID